MMMKNSFKSAVFNVLVLCLTQVFADWKSCAPCKCSISHQIKYADCTRKTINFVIIKIPDNLDSQIESVSLNEQSLTRIEAEAFSSNNLKKVILQKCKITLVHKDAFKNLRNLSDLNLAYNEIKTLDRDTFKFNKDLKTVRLNNNKLKTIDNELFANLTLLSILYLNDNQISSIHRLGFETNVNIRSLYLQNNLLTNIDSYVLQKLFVLLDIYLYGNPWFCDCNLKKVYEELHNRQFFSLNAKCQEPEKYRELVWMELRSTDFKCSLEATWHENITKMNVYHETITLSCIVEAFPEPTITWTHHGHVINAQELNLKYKYSTSVNHTVYTYNLTIFNLTSTDNGEYKCKMNNTEQDIEKVYVLTIKPARNPVILYPKELTIAADVYTQNFVLCCVVSGIPAPDVTWRVYGYNLTINETQISKFTIPGTDNYWANLTFPSKLTLHDGRRYTCMATNSEGSASKSILLKVKQLQPPKLIATRKYLSPAELSNVTLACGITAIPRPEFGWKYGYLPLDPHLLPEKYSGDVVRDKYGVYWYNLTILNIQMQDSGEYHCAANNSEGFVEKIIKVCVKEIDSSTQSEPVSIILIIVVGCGLFGVLLVIVLVKCFSRYYATKNSSQEILFRQSYKD